MLEIALYMAIMVSQVTERKAATELFAMADTYCVLCRLHLVSWSSNYITCLFSHRYGLSKFFIFP